MMERLDTWIYSVACCGILLSLVQVMLPKGVWKQIGMLAGGILLVITMVDPLLGLDEKDLASYLSELTADQKVNSDQIAAQSEEMLERLIAEEYGAYISEKAKVLEISCEIQVICDTAAEGVPVPKQVVITGVLQPEERETLAALIEESLGVSRDSQIYEDENDG